MASNRKRSENGAFFCLCLYPIAVVAPESAQFGPYTLLGRLAVGGMAEVYRALAPRGAGAARTVVIKRMLPHVAAEASGTAMFEAEARIGGRVQDANVVELLGAGEVDGTPYLVLEYVPGCDLWRFMRWLRREGRSLGVEPALLIIRDLLQGLDAVHQACDRDGQPLEIVHRDISPSNILLSVHGEVKLSDFGIARARLALESPKLSNQAKGKLGYLSPEQVAGRSIDQRADVFAAGVVAAELLLGRELFSGGSELAILLAIRDANVQPFAQLHLDEALRNAILSALHKDPDERTPTAAAFADQLSPLIRSPQSAVRRELTELVRLASGGSADDDLQRTPDLAHWAADIQPTPSTGVLGPFDDGSRPSYPATADIPDHTYAVETSEGVVKGVYSFADLAQAMTVGELGPHDLVSVDGGLPRPIRDQPGLQRHLPMASMTPATMDHRVAQEPDIRRNFAAAGFIRGIAHTAVAQETGLWLCEQGGSRKEVYVSGGVPAFVGSNIAGEMLGETLVAQGALNRGQLDAALAVMPRFDGRLGDTLVAMGMVKPVGLFQHIAAQVREKLLDLFTWTSGTASFYRGVPPPPSRFPLGLDIWEVLDAGLARRIAEGLEEERFRTHMLDSLEPVPQLPRFALEGSLPEGLDELLELSTGSAPLPDIIERMEHSGDETRGYRAVLLGILLELVRWRSEE